MSNVACSKYMAGVHTCGYVSATTSIHAVAIDDETAINRLKGSHFTVWERHLSIERT